VAARPFFVKRSPQKKAGPQRIGVATLSEELPGLTQFFFFPKHPRGDIMERKGQAGDLSNLCNA
ncbi:hypothetical protein, partial [Phormidium sp. CCY1219]|uniref:hypothetical protein n=1 Tax=Phormidium sp. CCY1219 TaxID=2886104 RepID=UPI002D1F06B0